MRIKNEYVDIVLGERKYHLKNKILKSYLSRIVSRQNSQQGNFQYLAFSLNYCFLKFDTALEANEPTIDDFDVWITVNPNANNIEELGNSGISVKYNYSDNLTLYDIKNDVYYDNNGLQNFAGRKITAIGFNGRFNKSQLYPESNKMCAVLDTFNYNIVINEGESLLVVRKDTITSDAEMITDCPKIIKSPVHLRPYGLKELESTNPNENLSPDKKTYKIKGFANAYLKNISLAFNKKESYKDIQIARGIADTEIIIIGTDRAPIELPNLPKNLIYPSNKIYPHNNLYPINKKYKYLFFNYQIYQMEYTYNLQTGELQNEEIIDTGYTYSMIIPLQQEEGKFVPIILYESEGKNND